MRDLTSYLQCEVGVHCYIPAPTDASEVREPSSQQEEGHTIAVASSSPLHTLSRRIMHTFLTSPSLIPSIPPFCHVTDYAVIFNIPVRWRLFSDVFTNSRFVLSAKHSGDQIKFNEMGVACVTHAPEAKCVLGSGGQNWTKENLQNLNVDGRMELNGSERSRMGGRDIIHLTQDRDN